MKTRRFTRIMTHLPLTFFRDAGDRAIRYDQKGIIENCGVGGMFIATEHLFSQGSVFTIELELPVEQAATAIRIQARAIVRWVQRVIGHAGMGVELIVFNGSGKYLFTNWLRDASPHPISEGHGIHAD